MYESCYLCHSMTDSGNSVVADASRMVTVLLLVPQGWLKMCLKSYFEQIVLKLATNGQSDKGFLLTSTFVPKGLSAPALVHWLLMPQGWQACGVTGLYWSCYLCHSMTDPGNSVVTDVSKMAGLWSDRYELGLLPIPQFDRPL